MERQVRRRRRPALSCVECRRRKIRCDKAEPCAPCVVNRVQCIYQAFGHSPAGRSRIGQNHIRGSLSAPRTDGSLSLSPARRASEFREIEAYIDDRSRERISTAFRGGENESASSVARAGVQQVTPAESFEVDSRSLLERIQALEGNAGGRVQDELQETPDTGPGSGIGGEDTQIVLNKTRVMKWSMLMGNAPEFAEIFSIYSKALGDGEEPSFPDAETENRVNNLGELLQKCKQVARAIKLGRPSRSLSSPNHGLTPPSREIADKLVALYFRSFESTYRILHIPTFWNVYRSFWDCPDSVTMDLRFQVLLVMAIGSSVYEHDPADIEFRHIAHQWVYAAQLWLSGPLEKDRLNIIGLQIYCLVILAREVLSLGGDLVWMSMGSLVHRAMQMGLHRDPKHLPAMPVLQAELRRRLWATILEMLVQSSLDSALPPRLSLCDFDTEPPANVNDDEMDESTKTLPSHLSNTCTATSIQLTLLDSLPTRLRIVQLLNGLHVTLSYSEVLRLNSEIDSACRRQAIFMTDQENAGVTAFHRNLLDYLVRRFVIPLHCPFASKSRTNSEFYLSRKTSLDAAMALFSPEPDEHYSRLMAVGGGLFREGIRCAGTVISLEFLSHIESQRLDGTLRRSSQYRQLLQGFLEGLLASSTERIRQGETNIKMHTFVCMILAQAAAVQENAPSEPKVTQAAKDSLELCYDLLNQRAAAMPLPNFSGTEMFDVGTEIHGLDFDLDFFFANPSPP